MSFKKRRIYNKAASVSKRESEIMYEQAVENLQNDRKEVGLLTSEVDEGVFRDIKGEEVINSWYTNRCQGLSGGHIFTLYDFHLLKLFFQHVEGGFNSEQLKKEAQRRTNAWLSDTEFMFESVSVPKRRIENALDKKDGWVDNIFEDSGETNLLDYYKLTLFLEFVLVAFYEEGYIDEDSKEELVESGCLTREVVV